jgi:general secretion pathway protein C
MRAINIHGRKLTSAKASLEALTRSGWRRLRAQPTGCWVTVTEVAAAVSLAAVSAQLVWSLAGSTAWPATSGALVGTSPPPRASLHIGVLTTVDPFHRDVAPVAATAGEIRAPETMLNLQLYGIRAGMNGGSAIIAGADNIQKAYFVGQEIMPGVRLERVAQGRVTIRRNGVAESISLDKERPATPSEAVAQTAAVPASVKTPAEPASDEWRRVSGDVAALFASLKFTPRAEGGVVLQSGAALVQFGFSSGDVLVAVNGTPVRDVANLTAVATTWRDAERLTLEVERAGQRIIHKIAVDR